MSRGIWDWFVFAELRSMIGPLYLRYSLNQSDAKLKPKTCWWPAFSRALTISVTFILSFHLKGVFNFWPLRLLLFWFYDTQTKSALLRCDYILLNKFFSLVLTNAWQPTSRGRPQCQEKILASQQINMHSFGK